MLRAPRLRAVRHGAQNVNVTAEVLDQKIHVPLPRLDRGHHFPPSLPAAFFADTGRRRDAPTARKSMAGGTSNSAPNTNSISARSCSRLFSALGLCRSM